MHRTPGERSLVERCRAVLDNLYGHSPDELKRWLWDAIGEPVPSPPGVGAARTEAGLDLAERGLRTLQSPAPNAS
jgi:hypothetical protein